MKYHQNKMEQLKLQRLTIMNVGEDIKQPELSGVRGLRGLQNGTVTSGSSDLIKVTYTTDFFLIFYFGLGFSQLTLL